MRVAFPVLALVASTALAGPLSGAAAPAEPDVQIFLDAGAPPRIAHGAERAAIASETRGERVVIELALDEPFTFVRVNVNGWLEIERVAQALPRLNESFFTSVARSVTETGGSSLVLNATGTPRSFTLELGIPRLDPDGHPWSTRTLTIERDVTAPGFALGNVTHLTHYSFLYETRTDEYAIADVRIAPAEGGDVVENPTPVLSLRQTFPIQGLDADTPYAFRVRFTDWSGNVVESAPVAVRTLPEPVRPRPLVTRVAPSPNATVPAGDVRIEAAFESHESPIAAGGVRLFFDKRELEAREFALGDGIATYVPAQPLAPGLHSASVEVTNEAGGLARKAWTFTVARADARDAPAAAWLVLAALGVTAVATAQRPRRQP